MIFTWGTSFSSVFGYFSERLMVFSVILLSWTWTADYSRFYSGWGPLSPEPPKKDIGRNK
jgi:hypothetical protein